MRIALSAVLVVSGLLGCGVQDVAEVEPADQPAEPTPAVIDTGTTMPNEPATETVKAEAGVGKQGQSLQGEGGMLVTPIKAFFNTQQRLTFDVQLKQAFDLYKAKNGSAPKSHDEYMQKVVAANQIRLPELPAGHKYVYDVEQETLMVERPK